jgi:hypothetical protein
MASSSGTTSSALIVAHPGHELRVHGWLERERPLVCVLTDGSGHSGVSRLPSTLRVLRRAGARPGPVFGRFTDRGLYEVLLGGRIEILAGVARELAEVLATEHVERVAGDAVEGFNPSHDLCRLLIDTAVAMAARWSGRAIESFDFLLEGPPGAGGVPGQRLDLDDEALERKLAAARGYPELRDEVERTFARHGAGAFRVECLRPTDPGVVLATLVEDPPYYERYGERQVAAGHYDRVLRFREHFLPVARALRELGCTA